MPLEMEKAQKSLESFSNVLDPNEPASGKAEAITFAIFNFSLRPFANEKS